MLKGEKRRKGRKRNRRPNLRKRKPEAMSQIKNLADPEKNGISGNISQRHPLMNRMLPSRLRNLLVSSVSSILPQKTMGKLGKVAGLLQSLSSTSPKIKESMGTNSSLPRHSARRKKIRRRDYQKNTSSSISADRKPYDELIPSDTDGYGTYAQCNCAAPEEPDWSVHPSEIDNVGYYGTGGNVDEGEEGSLAPILNNQVTLFLIIPPDHIFSSLYLK